MLPAIFPLTSAGNFSIFSLTFPIAGGWSNGKTADSDSAYRGSNPCPPATSVIAPLFFHTVEFLFNNIPPILQGRALPADPQLYYYGGNIIMAGKMKKRRKASPGPDCKQIACPTASEPFGPIAATGQEPGCPATGPRTVLKREDGPEIRHMLSLACQGHIRCLADH